uniref:Uncharacterized protein n=1 Tax=Physcomitrium patens TaxID=3218 RepID=A0A2K1JLX0_PHYPA|nr:hypothetical protein PHYPA_017370 [Physcomitrium patens]
MTNFRAGGFAANPLLRRSNDRRSPSLGELSLVRPPPPPDLELPAVLAPFCPSSSLCRFAACVISSSSPISEKAPRSSLPLNYPPLASTCPVTNRACPRHHVPLRKNPRPVTECQIPNDTHVVDNPRVSSPNSHIQQHSQAHNPPPSTNMEPSASSPSVHAYPNSQTPQPTKNFPALLPLRSNWQIRMNPTLRN